MTGLYVLIIKYAKNKIPCQKLLTIILKCGIIIRRKREKGEFKNDALRSTNYEKI